MVRLLDGGGVIPATLAQVLASSMPMANPLKTLETPMRGV